MSQMMQILMKLTSLPGPFRLGGVLAGGAVILALVWIVAPKFWPVAFVALLLAGLAFAIYKMVLKGVDKRRSKPFERRLAENAGAAPTGAGGAAQRARLDDLRRKFEQGVSTFREHGKDMYSLPWYLLVGEPGSGKTEAIRHCNVGFPPGLQDQLQGAGGTLNMNWWFTNHAVILDTAGKLMFEEVEPGKTSEWREFLKLLRMARPNCPVNGMLLVIPADSLIADTADSIQKKGGRIAEQLDAIQRQLGVRFPVFVVITKCDLINGFREFFRELNDPQLQHQIMGWSNPDDLDQPFKPERVEQHLKDVAERLRRRRLGLMIDPVHREDPHSGRRIDEVDALYAFPDALLKLSTRLKMYLEMVFVAGEWSAKPLFLRGIYFTSSMQEGAELDAELAGALGLDVKALPEGEGFRRNVAYFLRDLFISKVFREKGLVTNATNARKQQKRRRTMVMGAGILATMSMMGATFFAGRSHKAHIGDPTEFWQQVAKGIGDEGEPATTVIYDGKFSGDQFFRAGDRPIEIGGQRATVLDVVDETYRRAREPDPTPLMFRPAGGIVGDVFAKEKDAHAQVLRMLVIDPAVQAVREKLLRQESFTRSWLFNETEAFREMILVHRATEGDTGLEPIKIAPLLGFLHEQIPEGDPSSRLQAVIDGTYGEDGLAAWPPRTGKMHGEWKPGVQAPLEVVAKRFVAIRGGGAASGGSGPGDRMSAFDEVGSAMRTFAEREQNLRDRVRFSDVETVAAFSTASEEYLRVYAELEKANERLDRALSAVGDLGSDPAKRLVELALSEVQRSARPVMDDYDVLLNALGESKSPSIEPVRAILQEGRRQLEASNEQRVDDFKKVTGELGERLVGRSTSDRFSYQSRMRSYAAAKARLEAARAGAAQAGVFTLRERMDQARRDREAALAGIALEPSESRRSEVKDAYDLSVSAIDAANRKLLHDFVRASLDGVADEQRVVELVRDRVVPESLMRPRVPFTRLSEGDPLDARYHPAAAEELFKAFAAVEALVGQERPGASAFEAPLDRGSLGERAKVSQTAVRRYADSYARYWSDEIEALLAVNVKADWDSARNGLIDGSRFSVRQINTTLFELYTLADEALGFAQAVQPGAFERERARLRDKKDLVDFDSRKGREYRGIVQSAIDKWTQASDPGLTRGLILGLSQRSFQRDFLGEGTLIAGSEDGVPYYAGIIKWVLESLVERCESDGRESFRQIVQGYRQFPLCADGGGDLSLEQVRSAAQQLARVTRIGTSREWGPDTIGGGENVSAADLRVLIDRLRAGGDLTRPERDWMSNELLPALSVLLGSDLATPELLRWRLIGFQPSDPNVPLSPWPEAVLTGPGIRQTTRLVSFGKWEGEPLVFPIWLEQSAPLQVEFHSLTGFASPREGRDAGDLRVERLRLSGWTVLNAILRGQGAQMVFHGEQAWAIDYTIGGTKMSLIVQFEPRDRDFSPRRLESWPRSAGWGGGRR
ncbi:MAG: hypothetical protein KIT24_04010 [Phycisphaeraceae bacterium]|nr:hypothetical protein [Phycisphaeraceae bacterium]